MFGAKFRVPEIDAMAWVFAFRHSRIARIPLLEVVGNMALVVVAEDMKSEALPGCAYHCQSTP